MIHVCFSLHDKTGRYSKFTGTTILSLFENTTSDVTVHILHDNTLTNDNRDKFIYLAGRYGQAVKFYNVAELCADKIEDFKNFVPLVKTSRLSIGAMYRLTAPQILPPDINRVIYLDSDIIVNLDIKELWKIELDDKAFAAVPEVDFEYNSKIKFLIVNGYVNSEDYFNSGVLLMNLDYMRNAEEVIMEGVKFCGQYPQCDTLDQDILNYLFSKNYLKLPERFDVFVGMVRQHGQHKIRKAIYHYYGGSCGVGIGMDTNDAFNRLWMDYFLKSPWFDSSAIGRLYKNVRQDQTHMRKIALNLSSTLRDKARAFMVLEKDLNSLVENFSVRNDEEILLIAVGTHVQKIIAEINSARNEKIFFVMLPDFPFNALTKAGLVYGRDFVNASEFLSEAQGVPMNSYPLVKAM